MKLHTRHLVAEALELMRKEEVNSLPVYDNDYVIGTVAYDELIAFLGSKAKNENLYAHKLHFDLESALVHIRKMRTEVHKMPVRDDFTKKLILGLSSVAIITMALLGLTWLFFKPAATPLNQSEAMASTSERITLTLANGKRVMLSDAKTGIEITSAGLKYVDGTKVDGFAEAESVNPNQGNQNGVTSTTENSSTQNKQMIVNVPAGSTYMVILPDGSKVWLNAKSNLKFPSTFAGFDKRSVELDGEAYFEVAKVTRSGQTVDADHRIASKVFKNIPKKGRLPFVVMTDGQEIEVLGTHFNVNAYNNEADINTTLLEGSVRVIPVSRHHKLFTGPDPSSLDPIELMGKVSDNPVVKTGDAVLLKPNQQATLTGANLAVKTVDAEDAIAWRKGEFIFRNMPLENIMRVISRWYNVDVAYQNESVSKQQLGGIISKNAKIAEVLQMLELTANVHFKLDGRKITVIK